MAVQPELLSEERPHKAGKEFLLLYQKALLRALHRQGILNEQQLQECLERLEQQTTGR